MVRFRKRKNRFHYAYAGTVSVFAVMLLLLQVLLMYPSEVFAASSGYLLPNSSYEYVTSDQVEGFSSQALCYARNEIYARNGLIFTSAELQQYFGRQYWYHGIYSPDQFSDSMLNEYETANVAMLLSLEQAQGGYVLDQPGYSFDSLPTGSRDAQASDSALDEQDAHSSDDASGEQNTQAQSSGSAGQSDQISQETSDERSVLNSQGNQLPQESLSSQGGETATESIADAFTVDPNSYIFPDSAQRVLTDAEISQLTLQELCYARNEIYARHGYIFSSTELSDYFNAKNWYWGTLDAGSFSDSMLNYAEAQNADSLYAREQSMGGYQTDQPGYSYSSVGSYPAQETVSVTESDYIFYDSAIRYLTDSDLSGLGLQQLCYARNEIYARRGYIFQSEELRNYFAGRPWYIPLIPAESFSESIFNEMETANIALLRQYEYALNPNGYQLY